MMTPTITASTRPVHVEDWNWTSHCIRIWSFGNESFQAIDCTGSWHVNRITNSNQKYTKYIQRLKWYELTGSFLSQGSKPEAGRLRAQGSSWGGDREPLSPLARRSAPSAESGASPEEVVMGVFWGFRKRQFLSTITLFTCHRSAVTGHESFWPGWVQIAAGAWAEPL